MNTLQEFFYDYVSARLLNADALPQEHTLKYDNALNFLSGFKQVSAKDAEALMQPVSAFADANYFVAGIRLADLCAGMPAETVQDIDTIIKGFVKTYAELVQSYGLNGGYTIHSITSFAKSEASTATAAIFSATMPYLQAQHMAQCESAFETVHNDEPNEWAQDIECITHLHYTASDAISQSYLDSECAPHMYMMQVDEDSVSLESFCKVIIGALQFNIKMAIDYDKPKALTIAAPFINVESLRDLFQIMADLHQFAVLDADPDNELPIELVDKVMRKAAIKLCRLYDDNAIGSQKILQTDLDFLKAPNGTYQQPVWYETMQGHDVDCDELLRHLDMMYKRVEFYAEQLTHNHFGAGK